tara:strand:+ start:245 stop:550 length:306 start_codon:yes stop_codon:yes gene_type:complete
MLEQAHLEAKVTVLMEALVIYVELEFVFHRLVAVEEDNREDLEGDLVFTVEQQDQETQEVIAHQKEMTVDQEALVMVSQEAGAAQVALDNLVTEITKAEQV